MPVDRNTRDLLSPFLAMSGGAGAATASPGWWAGTATAQALPPQAPALAGGARRFKRAVSETKKKFVASSQSWRCGHCKSALNHTFEVDHIVSLNSGGSNEVDNLVALCPTCHREKTARENM
jgi:5-methylcytosine-specific restriction protein A